MTTLDQDFPWLFGKPGLQIYKLYIYIYKYVCVCARACACVCTRYIFYYRLTTTLVLYLRHVKSTFKVERNWQHKKDGDGH
jgi:hypothetical protein